MTARLKRTIAWLNRSLCIGAGPADVLIEVTSHCNLQCPYCRRTELVSHPTHMTMALFRTTLEHVADTIDMAFLFGWGEPFLWPHLADGIALSRAMNVHTNVTTNAAYAFTDTVRKAIHAGPELLVISLDSHIPEVYERYRAGSDFEQIVATSRKMIAAVGASSTKTTVVMQMIRWPEMRGFETDYISFARSLGVVDITIRRNFIDTDSDRSTAMDTRRRTCPVLWRGPAYIRSDGVVFPCCLLTDFPLGNIETDTLADLWNCETMQFLRERHRNGEFGDLTECSACYHTRSGSYPAGYALAGCLFGGSLARRWMFRIDRITRGIRKQ